MPVYALGDLQPTIHPDAYVAPDAVVIGDVTLGAGSSVWPGAVLRGDFGRIEVGARTSIQDGTVLHTTEEWPTLIGDDCVVGHRVHLEGCVVEDRCLVGSGSVVLNRARVGTRSIVGAQALVVEGAQVPPGSLVLGVPGTVRRVDEGQQHAFIERATAEYVAAARHHRTHLRLIETDPSTGGTVTSQPDTPPPGRPVAELSDTELEQQGKQAHDTRNWVFLNGTAEQFATHTTRMLELEQEYLLRHPKRTWQGYVETLDAAPAGDDGDPIVALLGRIEAAGGRMHKLEVHQAAREVGLDRAALARLYTGDEALVVTERSERVLTDAGRARLGG